MRLAARELVAMKRMLPRPRSAVLHQRHSPNRSTRSDRSEVKSRQGKAIEGLVKKVQDLEAELAKAHSEARDSFENGRMVALLSAETDWEAKEAKPRSGAEPDYERQIGVVRNFLEGQIAELSKQLGQYRAEAGEYKKIVEGES